MVIRAAVAFGLSMKIPVLNIQSHRQPHLATVRKWFVFQLIDGRAVEMKHRGIASRQHAGSDLNFHRASVTGAGDKIPDRRWPRLKRCQIPEIERRKKAVGIHPYPRALRKNMTVHRQAWMKVCPEQAVVF